MAAAGPVSSGVTPGPWPLTVLSPWLARLGLGRLPGDVKVRVKGRDYFLPFTTTLLLSLALTAIARLL